MVFESENLILLAEILHHLGCKIGASRRRCAVVRSLHAGMRPDSVRVFLFQYIDIDGHCVCVYIYTLFLLFDTYFDLYDSSND